MGKFTRFVEASSFFMSNSSNDFGRAFEYIFLIKLDNEIKKKRQCVIIKNSSYLASHRAWLSIPQSLQQHLEKGAVSCITKLFEMEPLMLENALDILELYIQSDDNGQIGDVRDVVAVRKGIKWEIGFSLKHNHFAVKHSRLSNTIDFGKQWFEHPCSDFYWKSINPIFKYLNNEKNKRTPWSALPNKENDVYYKLLVSFITELKRQNEKFKDVPRKMVEYLLGKYDFYKVVGIDAKQITEIQAYNLRGHLNQSSKGGHPKIVVPVSALPTKILYLDFYQNKKNTIQMCLDKGWSFTFRIHNASTIVEPSLKFDIQIIGMPTTILTINCKWC